MRTAVLVVRREGRGCIAVFACRGERRGASRQNLKDNRRAEKASASATRHVPQPITALPAFTHEGPLGANQHLSGWQWNERAFSRAYETKVQSGSRLVSCARYLRFGKQSHTTAAKAHLDSCSCAPFVTGQVNK